MTLLAVTGASIYLQLPVVIIIISFVYSATRYDDWPSICHEAFRWAWRMATFLLGIALALYVVSLFT